MECTETKWSKPWVMRNLRCLATVGFFNYRKRGTVNSDDLKLWWVSLGGGGEMIDIASLILILYSCS